MKMSWVTLDRICEEKTIYDAKFRRQFERNNRPLRFSAVHLSDEELLEKLRGLGFDFDRAGLERLCDGALSAEEVVDPLLDSCDFASDAERMDAEWIWICLVALWQRWWPEKVCLELLDDKIQAGYRELEHDATAAAATWLGAWSDVGRLCDIAGIHSIREFDDRFPMTQSLFNWSQDLEDALWNAGLSDPEFLAARIAVCEEALRRFPGEERWMTDNRRRALAESYFEIGEVEKATALFEQWLTADPRWGWGWIGWADLYAFGQGRPNDYGRAEELLRRGYSTPAVRDADAIAARLQRLCEETGRETEARELARQAKRLAGRRGRAGPPTVSRTLDLEGDGDDEPAVVRETATASFGDEGPPLDRLADIVHALQAATSVQPARSEKVGRNVPCPCGSGRKFKKCCGSGSRGMGTRDVHVDVFSR